MLTKELIEQRLGTLQKDYVAYMLKNLDNWRIWAEASNRMEAGKKVSKDEFDAYFNTQYEWTKTILEIENQGSFNWHDPRITDLFKSAVKTEFYQFWGDRITEIALQLAVLSETNTLLEIGAGRGDLTKVMLGKLADRESSMPLITTDTHEAVLENTDVLKASFPCTHQNTFIWDINSPPPDALLKARKQPVLLYERASLTYAQPEAIKNLALAADIVVLGDYFNCTGELFGYDRVFAKVGLKTLFFQEVKPMLKKCFPNWYVFDQSVTDTLGIPNVTLIIAWKNGLHETR